MAVALALRSVLKPSLCLHALSPARCECAVSPCVLGLSQWVVPFPGQTLTDLSSSFGSWFSVFDFVFLPYSWHAEVPHPEIEPMP